MSDSNSSNLFRPENSSKSDSSFQFLDSVASTQTGKKHVAIGRAKDGQPLKNVALESAVYGHIRAMRALGNTTLSTDQIARALSLPRSAVDAAVRGMSNRGVKIAK